MNEKLKSFINNVGLLCETWTIVYNNFRKQGLSRRKAKIHTREFMIAFITASLQHTGGKK